MLRIYLPALSWIYLPLSWIYLPSSRIYLPSSRIYLPSSRIYLPLSWISEHYVVCQPQSVGQPLSSSSDSSIFIGTCEHEIHIIVEPWTRISSKQCHLRGKMSSFQAIFAIAAFLFQARAMHITFKISKWKCSHSSTTY